MNLAEFTGAGHHRSVPPHLNQAHDQLLELVERVGIELELMKVAKELEG